MLSGVIARVCVSNIGLHVSKQMSAKSKVIWKSTELAGSGGPEHKFFIQYITQNKSSTA